MNVFRAIAVAAIAPAIGLCGCSTGAVGSLPTVHAVSPTSGTLQFAVGTARIGLPDGSTTVGLNVVATYRQANGLAATLQNTPTLSAPAGSAIFGGSDTITGVTPAALHQQAVNPALPASTNLSGFGTLVGVFGYGFAPLNLVDYNDHIAVFDKGGVACDGPIFSSQLYPTASPNRPDQAIHLPMYVAGPNNQLPCNQNLAASSTTHAPPPPPVDAGFVYLGGPPAWPSPSGYGTANGFLGYPAGFMDFVVQPAPGVYALSVAVPTNVDDSTFATVAASATLPASAVGMPLPGMPQPQIRVHPDGSATVQLTVPPGLTESVVFITTEPASACGSGAESVRYAVVTHTVGPQSLLISNNLGPPDTSGKPTPTFCVTGNPSYSAEAVGFDYPAREASYPESTTPTPAITNGDGHTGTADITTSTIAHQAPYVPQ